jgi:sister-chromatid-cohesion protein PDS5
MHHKDTFIQLYTANNLAHLLKLYAPDAPLSPAQLAVRFRVFTWSHLTRTRFTYLSMKDMFKLFIHCWKHIGNTQSTYFPLSYSLLENVATVRSSILALDLPDSENLVRQIIAVFYSVYK